MSMQQLTIADAAQAVKLQKQSECSHEFIEYFNYDYEYDRVYEESVCIKCGVEN